MSESNETEAAPTKIPETTWKEFITTAPTAVLYRITDSWVTRGSGLENNQSDIVFFCSHCEGERIFKVESSITLYQKEWTNGFVQYDCKNCGMTRKVFALSVLPDSPKSGLMIKIGEWPHLSINTPSKVSAFLGRDLELFHKGLKAEAQGLGIGAFGYYRRVVDNQWQRILGFLIKAAKNIHTDQVAIDVLEKAARENQFKKAVEMVKDAIPPSLLLGGKQNPITLLYGATSDGIHNLSDGECLEVAKDIRIILTELADRMTKALSDQSALDSAVRRLSAMASDPGKKAPSQAAKPEP